MSEVKGVVEALLDDYPTVDAQHWDTGRKGRYGDRLLSVRSNEICRMNNDKRRRLLPTVTSNAVHMGRGTLTCIDTCNSYDIFSK